MTPNLSIPLALQDGASRLGWNSLLDAMAQGVVLVDAKGRYLDLADLILERKVDS